MADLPVDDRDKNEEDVDETESPQSSSPLTPLEWIKIQMEMGIKPEEVLQDLVGPRLQLPVGADDISLWEAVLELVLRPPSRQPLDHVISLDDIVRLIQESQKIIVLSGAGISVSCGIPDFRSPEGLYSKLAIQFPDLPDPQAMFDIRFFELDPRPFFSFAKEIFPGKYEPSVSHRFIKALEDKGKLLRNYTQNIDTLENTTGIERVVYCHGSFSSATCRHCKHKVNIDVIKEEIMREEIPYCSQCLKTQNNEDDDNEIGIMKPDIVFFGEGLPESFHQQLQSDKTEADLLIVIGSSLKVRPVSLIPEVLPSHVPQVLINREPLQYIPGFDVRLLGYSDVIVTELCRRLGKEWVESIGLEDPKVAADVSSPESRVHLFDGGLWKPPSPSLNKKGNTSCTTLKKRSSSDSIDGCGPLMTGGCGPPMTKISRTSDDDIDVNTE